MNAEPVWTPASAPHFPGQVIASTLHDITLLAVLNESQPRLQKTQKSNNPEAEAMTLATVEKNPPKSRTRRLDKSLKPAVVACKKAIRSLCNKKENYAGFNKIADRIKKHSGWETVIRASMLKLSDDELLELIHRPVSEYRGYDRVVLKEMLSAATEVIRERKLASVADLGEFESFIASLETLTLTVDESNLTLLGGGAVNKVFLVKYTDPRNGEILEAVFKPDPCDLDAFTKFKEARFGTAAAAGIPPGAEGHLPSRAVTSSKVDQLLWGHKAVSVKTQFVTVNGRRGILMQKAKGKAPKPGRFNVTEEIDLNQNPEIRRIILDDLAQGGQLSERVLGMIAAAKNYDQVEFEGDEGKFQLIGRKTVRQLDPENPVTVSGLIRLQIKDIICGEVDRHPENYFIDNDGNVTGIDEDCCFGVNALPEGDVRAQEPIVIVPGIAVIPNNASLMLRMPPVVTREMYNQVVALATNPQLSDILNQNLTLDEAVATIDRIGRLIQHMESDACRIVNTDAELVSRESMSSYDTNNSLLIREIFVQRGKGEEGWNFLRAHRI